MFTRIICICLFFLSTHLSAMTDEQSELQTENSQESMLASQSFQGSAKFGGIFGIAVPVILLIKDALNFHFKSGNAVLDQPITGAKKVLVLALIPTLFSLGFGIHGYYNDMNYMGVFY